MYGLHNITGHRKKLETERSLAPMSCGGGLMITALVLCPIYIDYI